MAGHGLVQINKVSAQSRGQTINGIVQICGCIARPADAVSYTHLDVYKRQGLYKATEASH